VDVAAAESARRRRAVAAALSENWGERSTVDWTPELVAQVQRDLPLGGGDAFRQAVDFAHFALLLLDRVETTDDIAAIADLLVEWLSPDAQPRNIEDAVAAAAGLHAANADQVLRDTELGAYTRFGLRVLELYRA
jgi:hypothetical protein